MIILISGKQSSGKTELVNSLNRKFNKFLPIKFAKPLYEIQDLMYKYLEQYGIPYEEKDGEFLQFIGEHGRKKFGEDVWVNIAAKKIEEFGEQNKDAFICIDDCRHTNEFDKLLGILKIRLECREEVRKARCSHWRKDTSHPSEVGLDGYSRMGKFNLYIDTEFRGKEETLDMALRAIDEFSKKGVLDHKGDYDRIFGGWS